jgi:hypothetical protein
MFEEFLGKPLKIEITQQFAEIYGEWRRLGDEGIEISSQKEKQLLRIVERSILVYGEKSKTPDFVRSAFEKLEKPEKVIPFLRRLKKFNEECATWYQFTLKQHPMHHRGVADEKNRGPTRHQTTPRTFHKQSSNPKEKRIGEKKEPCWRR